MSKKKNHESDTHGREAAPVARERRAVDKLIEEKNEWRKTRNVDGFPHRRQ